MSDLIGKKVGSMGELATLQVLSDAFPTRQSLYTEIINLRAILNLPRGTEHFISDIHGKYETFCHILNNCSGVIREKAERLLGNEMTRAELKALLTLIYYPEEKLARLRADGQTTDDWYAATIGQLIHLSRDLSSKYTRSKVRKAMPQDYASVLDELLHALAFFFQITSQAFASGLVLFAGSHHTPNA